MYAIVDSGGKQYRVSPNQMIKVERITAEQGGVIELDKVLLVADGDKVRVGRPTIAGSKVIAIVLGQGKGRKTIVFKYKPKVRYSKKTGHRQPYTRLAIKEIVVSEVS